MVYHQTKKLDKIMQSGGLRPRADLSGENSFAINDMRAGKDWRTPKGIFVSTTSKNWFGDEIAFKIEPTDKIYRAYHPEQGHILIANPIPTSRFASVNDNPVAEAFDNPYRGKWEKSEFGDQDVLVKLPDGTNLSIMFNHEGDDVWQVEFWRGASQNVTGEGDAQRIFATVIAAIQKFIKKQDPWRIIFSASKDVGSGKNPESRARLYNSLVARYARSWGYDEYNEDHGDQITYELTRSNADVKENFADGKGPGRPGDSQRHGIPKGATMAQLQKAAKAPGRKGQLARWQINMRRGRKKASEAIAPHGDPQNELRMLKAGTKPAALVNPWEFDTLYRPIADGMGWEVIEYTIPGFEGHRFYVVAQPGERDRAQRIVKLVKQANDTRISGEQIGPEYHRELGFLLGYKKDDVEHFIKNTYGDGKIDEGVWDTISDYGRTAASTVYGIGSAAADAAYDLGSKAVGSAAAFGRNAADVISLGGYKHARAYADYIAKQALKNIGYGSGSTYDRELKQEIEKLVRDDMDNPGAAGAGKLAGVVGAAAIPEIPVVGGIAGVGYKTAEVAHKVATAYKYARQMLGLQEGEVVRTAFGTRQAAKNRTPYRFNPDIAASIPLYDPEKRFGVAHKRPEHAQGGEVPFDRFEVNHKSERTSDIVGIIGDRRVVVSTTRPDIAEVLADAYNRGGFTAADIEMVREDGADKQGAALTVFDMDETLFHTKARVYVVRDGEVLHRLTNQEYNTYQLKPGETYDYREFRDARFFHDTSVPIERMWRKAQNLLDNIGKRPGSRVIIVTARTDLDDRETFLNTFRKHGLDIDKVHVHRAGNLPVPAAAAKKAIIATYLNSGKFDSVRLIDDAESNLKSFLSLRSEYPDVRFTAYLVLPGGHMAQYQA